MSRIDSKYMKNKETLNFRVPAEFKQKLIEEAKKQRRSLTNYVVTTFIEVWSSQEKEPRKKKLGQKHVHERDYPF